MHKKSTRLLLGLAITGLMGLMFASSASALLTRPLEDSFGTDGTSGTSISGPNGIAFSQSEERLYATSSSPNGIFGFDASTPGTYTPLGGFSPRALTVNPTGLPGLSVTGSGNIFLTAEGPGRLFGYDSTGAALAAFGGEGGLDPAVNPGSPNGSPKDICGSAVDPSGNIWVGNYSTRKLLEYDSTGTFLKAIDTSALTSGGRPCQLAIDQTSGDMFVHIYSNSVYKLTPPEYDPAGAVKIDPYEGGPTGPNSIGVDGTTHHVFVSHGSSGVVEYEADGTVVGTFGKNLETSFTGIAVNEEDDLIYVGGGSKVNVFGSPAIVPDVTNEEASNVTRTEVDVKGSVDLAGGGNATTCVIEYGPEAQFGGFNGWPSSTPCSTALPITTNGAIEGHLEGLLAQKKYRYRFRVGNENGTNVSSQEFFTTSDAIKDIEALPATEVGLESVTLNGHLDRDGYTTQYYFQWTYTVSFNNPQWNTVEVSATPPGDEATANDLSFHIPSGLKHGTTYYYRLVGTNEFGTTISNIETFYPSSEPFLDNDIYVTDVKTDQAVVHLTGNPNGLLTEYHIEYGDKGDCAVPANECLNEPEGTEIQLGAGVDDASNAIELHDLDPGTTYHYRIVMHNVKGTVTNTTDHTFTTFANISLPPPCPNDLVRQQTGAALLLDCRAFELVSAANTGGYDVESSLAPGQEPFAGYPEASNPPRVLYGIHNGAIPGLPGYPTNKGIDPYVSTRGSSGWSTRYVGIPANGTPSVAPFSSTLLAADSTLDSFAFGGPDLCAPCFDNGATGIPMRLPDGSLVQGMVGQEDPGALAAPDGLIRKPFSGDGSHFVFGSLRRYEPDGNNNTGDVSIYDHNMNTGVTQVVSKDDNGDNLECLMGAGECHSPGNEDGIAELDISQDGSRIVVGQLVSKDGAGNRYYHLYMHIGNDPETVDLTPGTSSGAHFAGMTKDGSQVYFTTRDPLTTSSNQDSDTSVDLFRASVDGGGSMSLSRVSIGTGAGNTDGCDPAGDSRNSDDWNTASGPTDCSVVAVGGGGGVAAGDGTIYFLSPEELDGNGDENAPNLFVVRPGSGPKFVTTLASNANEPFRPIQHLLDYELTGFSIPSAASYDHSDGSFYVMDNTFVYPTLFAGPDHPTSFVQKFTPEGDLDLDYAAAGKLDGYEAPTGGFRQLGRINGNAAWAAPDSIAVDNTCADQELGEPACATFDPSNGNLYVPDRGNNVVDKFDSDGNYISQIDVTEIVGTINIQVNGVVVDSNTGKVFVLVSGGGSAGGVLIYDNDVQNHYTGEHFATNTISNAADATIDSEGNFYLTTSSFSESPFVRKYSPPYTNSFTAFGGTGTSGLAYDIVSDHIFLDKGDHVEEWTAGPVQEQVGPSFGGETLEESYGLDAFNERLVVSNKGPKTNAGKFSVFTEPRIPPDLRYDDDLVIDSVNDGNTRHTKDFQITENGDIAAFVSGIQLDSYDPKGHGEVYRYDETEDELICVSCPPTNAAASGNSSLAENGLNLIEDGRMFFTATEPLVLRDTNGKEDVYEWNDGNVQPISPGQDQFGSKLLTVSADGKDAYFFTHAVLAPQDRNGKEAKIYDARELGGFFVVPGQPPCAASDECHGPGTQAAPPPDIGSYGGTPTRVHHQGCPKGKVKRNGDCVKRRKKHQRKHRRKGHGKKRHGKKGQGMKRHGKRHNRARHATGKRG